MPRRRSRFARLERDLRNQAFNPTKGTNAAEFFNFLKGINKIKQTKPATGAEKAPKKVAIYPFNKSVSDVVDPKQAFLTFFSTMSDAVVETQFNLKGKLGHIKFDPKVSQRHPNFYPALLRIFLKNPNQAAPATPTSGILKKQYNRYLGRSYAYPFGRDATLIAGVPFSSISEQDSLDALKDVVTAKTKLATMSYEPEEFGSPERDAADAANSI